jgi:hypothetical protein
LSIRIGRSLTVSALGSDLAFHVAEYRVGGIAAPLVMMVMKERRLGSALLEMLVILARGVSGISVQNTTSYATLNSRSGTRDIDLDQAE